MDKFLNRMKTLLGGEYGEFLRYYNGDNFRGLRVNTLKSSADRLKDSLGFELKPTPFCKEGFYIPPEVESLGNHPLHHAGAFYIQEPSAASAWAVNSSTLARNWLARACASGSVRRHWDSSASETRFSTAAILSSYSRT